jgi:hypothetical protein
MVERANHVDVFVDAHRAVEGLLANAEKIGFSKALGQRRLPDGHQQVVGAHEAEELFGDDDGEAELELGGGREGADEQDFLGAMPAGELPIERHEHVGHHSLDVGGDLLLLSASRIGNVSDI